MEFEQFTANSNEAVLINLVRDNQDVFEPFNPPFTYPIFGNEEVIVGYKKPKIEMGFRAYDMKPAVKISYSQKINPDNKVAEKLMDLEGQMKDFFPVNTFGQERNRDGEASTARDEQWSPPGKRIHTYRYDGGDFEVWQSNLSDKKAYEIINNMKALIPMFIEGGTVGFLDDNNVECNKWSMDRWKLFLLYQVESNSYTLSGFATSYRLWVFPTTAISSSLPKDSSPPAPELPQTPDSSDHGDVLSMPSRERISQFLILPPFQHQNHGIHLYNAVTSQFLSDPNVFEITVEDPNEWFDNLRDYCDLARLYSEPSFASLALPTSIPADALKSDATVPIELLLPRSTLTSIQHSLKLTRRQTQRLVEIHLLRTIVPEYHRTTNRISQKSQCADPHDRAYYFWRLLVKHRVYLRNKDQLDDLDESERVEKIEASVTSLQESYEQLIKGYKRRVEQGLGSKEDSSRGAERSNGAVARKRKVIPDDSDSDEVTVQRVTKRMATEELMSGNADSDAQFDKTMTRR